MLTTIREDIQHLVAAQTTYGDSWKKRGGAGTFMMLARKADRILYALDQQTTQRGNLIACCHQHQADAAHRGGVLEDIGDLRRYFLLCLAEPHQGSLETRLYLAYNEHQPDTMGPLSLRASVLFHRYWASLEENVEPTYDILEYLDTDPRARGAVQRFTKLLYDIDTEVNNLTAI